MTGVYMTLWDIENRHESNVLFPTRGGWPHVTIAYTGLHLTREELIRVSLNVFQTWANRRVLLTSARVSSFTDDLTSETRHSVLIDLDDVSTRAIEATRFECLKIPFAHKCELLTMRPPHVTAGIFKEEAVAADLAAVLNKNHLPYSVTVTGVSI